MSWEVEKTVKRTTETRRRVDMDEDQVEKALMDWAVLKLGFNPQNTTISIDAGRDFLRGVTITEVVREESEEGEAA